MKVIDVSAYNGIIDWKKAAQDIDGVILRSTTKSGALDSRFMENYNGILQECGQLKHFGIYRFTYARDFIAAVKEAQGLMLTLLQHGIKPGTFDCIYVDLEKHSGRDYTTQEVHDVLYGYNMICRMYNVKMGVYCSYSYMHNIVPEFWYDKAPFWVARWAKNLGDITKINVQLWQYTNKGKIAGIDGDVDVSKGVYD